MESSTRKKNTMIIAGMVVLTILAFLLINFFSKQGDNPGGDSAGPSKQALIEEIEELESSIVELEVVFQEIQYDEGMSKELLEEKRDEIKSFDLKVKDQRKKIEDLQARLEEAKRKGDVDEEKIAQLQETIDKAIGQQTELEEKFFQGEIEFLYMENRKLTAYSDSLDRLKPDSLANLVGDLQAQLRDCGTSSSSPVLTDRGGDIDEEDVQNAISALSADKKKAQLVLFNRTKKGDDELGNTEKASKMKIVLAKFSITDDNIERFLNGSEMYLVVKGLNGEEITSNNNRPSVKKCGDRDCVVAGEGLFKSGQGITFQFEPKEGKWVKAEAYIFTVYIDGLEVKREILSLK